MHYTNDKVESYQNMDKSEVYKSTGVWPKINRITENKL